jgi:hypothetical protein
MTKRAETNSHVMLNLFQHLVCFFSAFSRRTFHPRPKDGVFRCGLNKFSNVVLKEQYQCQAYKTKYYRIFESFIEMVLNIG